MLEKIDIFNEVDYYVVVLSDREIKKGIRKATAYYFHHWNNMIDFVQGLIDSYYPDSTLKCNFIK